jgi:hypothetical protein
MIFGRKKKKPNKKALQRLKNRRLQIIMEARRIHDKAQKKIRNKGKDDNIAMGGYTEVKSMEEQDIAFALGQATTKAIVMGGNALSKLKSRARKLKKSKTTHMKRLNKARKTMKARGRT